MIYLSLGAGVQSSALLAMSALGLHGCPQADVAIFADTQDEPAWVYEHLGKLAAWSGIRGIPVHTVTIGSLSRAITERVNGTRLRFAGIPAFTSGKDGKTAMLRRQCSREYKIEPIERHVRRLLGVKPRCKVRVPVTCLLGISLDEAHRMKPSRTRWITNAWPLIEARMRRQDCARLLQEVGLPVPMKSACVFCPFHSDEYWRTLKAQHPEEFVRACAMDATVRNATRAGIRNHVYLHRSLTPLAEIDFDRQLRLLPEGFANECDGVCGV